jgi:hypothetical protein
VPEGTPPWAALLLSEVQELRCAVAATGELLVEHTAEMQGLRTDTRRLELAILTLEGRAIVTEERLRPVEAVVLPLVDEAKRAANG